MWHGASCIQLPVFIPVELPASHRNFKPFARTHLSMFDRLSVSSNLQRLQTLPQTQPQPATPNRQTHAPRPRTEAQASEQPTSAPRAPRASPPAEATPWRRSGGCRKLLGRDIWTSGSWIHLNITQHQHARDAWFCCAHTMAPLTLCLPLLFALQPNTPKIAQDHPSLKWDAHRRSRQEDRVTPEARS